MKFIILLSLITMCCASAPKANSAKWDSMYKGNTLTQEELSILKRGAVSIEEMKHL